MIKPKALLEHEKPILVGDFTVTPYLIDHSACDSYAFVISCEGKNIIYTGDIREHGKKAALTKYFMSKLPNNAEVLLMEGTMLGRADERIETEEEVKNRAAEIMRQRDKPVFVLQSTTNIDRLVAMYNGAKETGRIFIIDIFAANILDAIGGKVSNILRKARVIYPGALTDRMLKVYKEKELMYKFIHKKIRINELGYMDNYCMLLRSSMKGILNNLKGIDGSTFIYSMWKGYEEREDIRRILCLARQKNMEIKYLHTSGHGGIETLQKIAKSCSAKKVITVHTEHPEKYKELFENAVYMGDGNALII